MAGEHPSAPIHYTHMCLNHLKGEMDWSLDCLHWSVVRTYLLPTHFEIATFRKLFATLFSVLSDDFSLLDGRSSISLAQLSRTPALRLANCSTHDVEID